MAAFGDLGSGSVDSSPAEVHKPTAEAVDTLVAEAAARRVRKDYAGCVAALSGRFCRNSHGSRRGFWRSSPNANEAETNSLMKKSA